MSDFEISNLLIEVDKMDYVLDEKTFLKIYNYNVS